MADDAAPAPMPANGGDPAGSEASATLLSQYVKDLSFENPNAPAVYQWQGQPQIDIQFNIQTSQLGDDAHEVVLKIDARASAADRVAFQVELVYGALFALRNVPAEQLQPFLLAEAPRLMFPFARRVLADAVRDGGFPPLMLEPVDFAQFYLSQAEGGALANPAGEA